MFAALNSQGANGNQSTAGGKGSGGDVVEDSESRDAVFMGTVHQSKGLEWPVVFVVRFNEEEFPLVKVENTLQN